MLNANEKCLQYGLIKYCCLVRLETESTPNRRLKFVIPLMVLIIDYIWFRFRILN